MDEKFENNNSVDSEFSEQVAKSEEVLDGLKQETGGAPAQSEAPVQPQTQSQPQPQPPVQKPAPVFTPPYGTQQNTPPVAFSGTGNGYTPYGYYPKPEAPKSKSKNKKKGLVIAIVIIAISFFVCCVFAVATIAKGVANDVKDKGLTSELFDDIYDNDDDDEDDDKINAEIPLQDNDDLDVDDDDYSASAIYKRVSESNVGVLVYSSNQSTIYSEGSGVILPTSFASGKNEGKTYIVTCAHVLENSSSYKTVIQLNDGTQYDATIVGVDKKTDIGVVSIKAKGLKSAQFASSSKISVGDTVYALGNPGGSTFFGSFTNGMVSAIGRPVNSPVGYEVACIQHTAPINPGNSGGALLNKYGQVIGINSSKIASTDFEGMGFAVPSETVKEIVEMLISNGYVKGRPILGITLFPSTYSQVHSVVVKTKDLPAGAIIINSISKNSDLNNKDVKKGDMIIGFNGKDLDDYNDLLEFVENSKVGDKIKLKICRIDQNYQTTIFDVEVKLVEDTGEVYEEEETTSNVYTNPFGFNFDN